MNNQDARPFVDLRKDAEEFKEKFNEDIKKCIAFLDSKITALICDPDSLGSPSRGLKQNTLVEFSKAKYDIFIGVKNLVNEVEKEWLKYISEMKKLFVENVEIFLANTRLEVKLPSYEQQQLSPRKSPGNKRTSLTGSIYPIINTIAKNISVIGSPLQNKNEGAFSKEASSSLSAVNRSQFNRKSKLSATSSSPGGCPPANTSDSDSVSDDSEIVTKQASTRVFQGLGRERIILNKDERVEEAVRGLSQNSSFQDKVVEKPRVSPRGQRSTVSSKQGGKLNSTQDLKISSTSDDNESANETKQNKKSPVVTKKSKTKASLRNASKTSKDNQTTTASEDSQEISEAETEKNNSLLTSRGRRNRLPVRDPIKKSAVHEDNDNCSKEEPNVTVTNINAKTRRNKKAQHAISAEENKNAVSDKEQPMEIDISQPQLTTRSQRGKPLTNKENIEASSKKLSTATEKRKGKSSARKTNSDEEPSEVAGLVTETETEDENEAVLSRRSRKAPAKTGKKMAKEPVELDYDIPVRPIKSAARRKTMMPLSEDMSVDDIPAIPTKSAARRKTVMPVNVSEDVAVDDIPARQTKSTARRKTVMPVNVNEDVADMDLAPRSQTRSNLKRKTIGGASKLASVAPPKRLKGSQRISQNDDDAAANPLEDGDYSDWISLKNIDSKIPTQPAVYEVKVWRAKKPAFIGWCENLRQKLTLHKLQQNSGHKHLDKFIERNMNDILIRYEVIPSVVNAKVQVNDRVKSFVAQYKTTPAYN